MPYTRSVRANVSAFKGCNFFPAGETIRVKQGGCHSLLRTAPLSLAHEELGAIAPRARLESADNSFQITRSRSARRLRHRKLVIKSGSQGLRPDTFRAGFPAVKHRTMGAAHPSFGHLADSICLGAIIERQDWMRHMLTKAIT